MRKGGDYWKKILSILWRGGVFNVVTVNTNCKIFIKKGGEENET
jgi:hypothetical protein